VNRAALARIAPPLLTFVVGTALAEVVIRILDVSPLLLPRPSAVWTAATSEAGVLLASLAATGGAVLLGLLLSSTIGVAAAVALAASPWVQRAFYPYAIFFQIVPIVAIAPLLVIWFGYGERAVVAAAAVVSVFPVIANTLAGLLSVDPNLSDLFRLHGASRAATLWKLRLPWALPQLLTGLRIAAGLAVIGAIVGEFITGAGLGGLIQVARQQQAVDKVFAALLLSALLGVALFGLVNLISRFALRHWHASEKSNETPTPRRDFAVVVRDRLQPRR
jgi:NitT/TauT family transport system permease protein